MYLSPRREVRILGVAEPRSRTDSYTLRIEGDHDREVEVSKGSYVYGLQRQVAELITHERRIRVANSPEVDPGNVIVLLNGKPFEGNVPLRELVAPGGVINIRIQES